MRIRIFQLVCAALFSITAAHAQDVFGKWKTIDDISGEAKSIVSIYKEDGKVYGKIIEILDPKAPENPTCKNCTGSNKDKPIVGLVFLNGLEKDGDEYNDGKILDPENGKEYKCYIELEEANKLKVRGYIGFAFLGRTQYWYRAD